MFLFPVALCLDIHCCPYRSTNDDCAFKAMERLKISMYLLWILNLPSSLLTHLKCFSVSLIFWSFNYYYSVWQQNKEKHRNFVITPKALRPCEILPTTLLWKGWCVLIRLPSFAADLIWDMLIVIKQSSQWSFSASNWASWIVTLETLRMLVQTVMWDALWWNNVWASASIE